MNKIVVSSDIQNLIKANDFLEEQFTLENIPLKTQFKILTAFEELFSNICNYAYEDEKGEIEIEFFIKNNSAIITLIDSGIPFDPLKKEDPDVSLAVHEREIGGLGIFMVKKTMDEFKYKYKDGKNIVSISKTF